MQNGQAANHLALVDTENELQAQLSSDHGSSQLGLGFLRRIAGHEGLQEARGEGFELRTDLWGVLRAAKGLFLGTHARANAQGKAKDAGETLAQLEQAHDLHAGLADLAQQHGAQDPGKNQCDIARAIGQQNTDLRGTPTGNPDEFPEFARPHLTLSSPAGIQSATEGSTHIQSSQDTALTSGRSVGIAAGKSLYASVLESIALFVRKAGFRLIAAAGKIHIEAQDDDIGIIARKVVELISTHDWINLKATQGIRLNGGGTVLEISPAGILGFTNGKFLVHAASHATDGPQKQPVKLPMTDIKEAKIAESFVLVDSLTGLRIVEQPYRITLDDGQVIKGKTNDADETAQVLAREIQFAHVAFFHNDDTENPIAIYRPLLAQPARETTPPQTDEKREVRQIGSFNMQINDNNPPSSGLELIYAQCTPENWGMRYSTKAKSDDPNSTKLDFPVARQYVHDMQDALIQKIKWGKNYFGSGKPTLALEEFPLKDEQRKKLARLILPAIKKALTSPVSGPFALPAKAVPMVMVTGKSLGSDNISGSFDIATWTLFINTDMLAELFAFEEIEQRKEPPTPEETRQQQEPLLPEEIERQEALLAREKFVQKRAKTVLENFARTIYHEARHCQQDFRIFAMMQQQAKSFSLTPRIGQWPKAVIKSDSKLAAKIVDLSAHRPIPKDSRAQASIHRMAAGVYVFILMRWKNGTPRNTIPGYLPDRHTLNAEYNLAYRQAEISLTGVGAGGTPIDIQSMVTDPPENDETYVSCPWEGDAFYCGEIVQMYWRNGDVLDNQSAGMCSRRYIYDYNSRKAGKFVPFGGNQ